MTSPPQTEEEKIIAREMGFVELPSGQWVLPDPVFSPPLPVIQKYPYGHKCKVCKSAFRSQKARDSYCPSCHIIMEDEKRRLEGVLRSALEAPGEEQRKAWEKIENVLICPAPNCGWLGNQGRCEPSDIRLMLAYVPDWVLAAHRHFMRHAFWNRFPYTRRFAPVLTPSEWNFYYGPRRLWGF